MSTKSSFFPDFFDLQCEYSFCLNQSLLLPTRLILPIWRIFPCAAEDAYILAHLPPLFSLQEPLKNNRCALGALLIWSHCAQGKSELYFLQNTDQRGKKWPCFRRLFTSNLCLLSFFLHFLLFCVLVHFYLFFLHFVLSVFTSCLSVFFLFM